MYSITCKRYQFKEAKKVLPFQRREHILEKVKRETSYISDLANELDVSEVTVRRDIKNLEKENLVQIHHGGAVQFINTEVETGMDIREQIFNSEKDQIGRYAASLVNDGDLIFIDSGTTTKAMINYLKDKKDVVLVTNGFKNMEIGIMNDMKNLILLGGEFWPGTYSFLGSITEDELKLFHFDKSFIGVNGVDKTVGLTNANINESSLKKKAIQQSEITYTLVDHSKFNKKSKYFFASINETTIITNNMEKGYEELKNVIAVNNATKEGN